MFWLTVKKSFFDAWDNLWKMVLCNFAFLLLMILGFWPMFEISRFQMLTGGLFFIVIIPILFIAMGAISFIMFNVSEYKNVLWVDVVKAVKKNAMVNFGYSLIMTGFFILSFLGTNYYISIKSIFAVAAWSLLLWVNLGIYLAAIWIFAVRNRLSGGFWKSLKKCVLIMIDNIALTLFTGLIMIPLQVILWPLTSFAAFGPAGIQLYLNVSLRLLMHKYDWLEENPEAARQSIPWYELLVEEREKIGRRTLKGMIFPWKD